MNESLRFSALAAAVAVATLFCSGGEGASPTTAPEPSSPRATSRPTARIGEPKEFVPPTRRENGRVVLPLVFPDGTTAELVYPPSLGVAEMGLRPYRAGGFGPPNRPERDFAIFFEGVPGVWRAGDRPLATYESATGATAEYWEVADSEDPQGTLRHLILRFGSWYVAVWDHRGGDERRMRRWAQGLLGSETRDGFLVLRAKRPLRLTRTGQKSGPELMFEGGDPDRRIVKRPMLRLLPTRCDD
ncbi:MAG: hypothetical protein ACRDJL_10395 [Actinomycetota bacterium]